MVDLKKFSFSKSENLEPFIRPVLPEVVEEEVFPPKQVEEEVDDTMDPFLFDALFNDDEDFACFPNEAGIVPTLSSIGGSSSTPSIGGRSDDERSRDSVSMTCHIILTQHLFTNCTLNFSVFTMN